MLKLIAIGFLLTSITEASADGPLVIRNQNTQTFSGLSISTTSEPCAQIINSTNITIKGSQIGPCTLSVTPTTVGTNNVTISATNGAGTGSATLVLTINPSAAGFFVATNGSDANPGTLNAPFATLRRCQTAM